MKSQNRLRQYIRSWGPGIITVMILVITAFYHRTKLVSWFSKPSSGVTSGSIEGSGSREKSKPIKDTHAHEGNHTEEGSHTAEGSQTTEGSHSRKDKETLLHEDDIAYYTCSMHPSVKSNTPGTCPICSMDLTPVTQTELDTGMIVVDAKRRQLIGVKTDVVRQRKLNQVIRTVGIVKYDETRKRDISLKFNGWVGELFADYTGKKIEKGKALFTVYSPDLLSTQDEYLDAVKLAEESPSRGTGLVESVQQRLLLWDLTEEQIRELVNRGKAMTYVPILAPADGTIINKDILEGSFVSAGKTCFRIADLSSVWVEADIYEYELPMLEIGQQVTVTLSYLPDRRFEAPISYIYPYLDTTTRTGRIRVEIPNIDGALKPDMYANIEITIALGERLVIPEEAVLHAGDTRVVFLDHGEGRLEPRKIKVGIKNTGQYEVLNGLKAGDVIVTSGNFLIASESKLKSGIEKW